MRRIIHLSFFCGAAGALLPLSSMNSLPPPASFKNPAAVEAGGLGAFPSKRDDTPPFSSALLKKLELCWVFSYCLTRLKGELLGGSASARGVKPVPCSSPTFIVIGFRTGLEGWNSELPLRRAPAINPPFTSFPKLSGEASSAQFFKNIEFSGLLWWKEPTFRLLGRTGDMLLPIFSKVGLSECWW